MSPDSSKKRGTGRGAGGALSFDVWPLSFLLCDQLLGKSFCWCKVHMEGRYQSEVPPGVGKGGAELPGGNGGIAGLTVQMWAQA